MTTSLPYHDTCCATELPPVSDWVGEIFRGHAWCSWRLNYSEHILRRIGRRGNPPTLAYYNIGGLSVSYAREALEKSRLYTNTAMALYPKHGQMVSFSSSMVEASRVILVSPASGLPQLRRT